MASRISPHAAEARGAEIAQGLVDSFTLGGGQFRTKPGLVLVPEGRPAGLCPVMGGTEG
ncbi:hypothetical protein [Streptomyces sp. NPDC059092]|uniref:hypothetical protein n=1 Tax=Streptomyces sp. NPDC059092 TaxID=3346725 RepID=UPI0036BEE881